jgi:carboxymethylenebutenolidase
METYTRITSSFFAAGAIERDAVAYAAFLDGRPGVENRKKLGVIGYCLGGMCMMRTAAILPGRIGAGVSLHGGPLVTPKPDSPHLLAPKIKARLYFAIASDDDQKDPNVKSQLRTALSLAKVHAELEVYPDARHGWCVPDSKAASNKQAVELAWTKMMTMLDQTL